MTPTDVCWCGLSRALHDQGAPETRDHRFGRDVARMGDECENCGAARMSHEIALSGRARFWCPGRKTEWEPKEIPKAVEIDTSRTCRGCGCRSIEAGVCVRCGTRKGAP
jgi:ribosomal protein L32